MGIPVILATAAACGSLVTTMKSGWELSRMIRQKRDQRRVKEDALRVYRSLRRALRSGRISGKEYDHWLEKLLVAESEKNLDGLGKIRARLRAINDDRERRPHRNGSFDKTSRGNPHKQTYRSYDDDKCPKSVRLDVTRTYYVPDPPRRYQDAEWSQRAGSTEYFPMDDQFLAEEGDGPEVVALPRMQRSSSVSYQPPGRSPKPYSVRDEFSTGDEKQRGRSGRREAAPDPGSYAHPALSDEWYCERLGYRSRR